MIVRTLRLEKGLSQEQLAGMAGISIRTLQRIERGAKASPETLKCIAAALETEFSSLRKDQDMPATAETSSEEQRATEYVRDIRAFYIHLIQYAVVMVGLLIVNLMFDPSDLWVIWPALGWGIGVAAHGLSVFEVINPFGDAWEKRQIDKRLGRR